MQVTTSKLRFKKKLRIKINPMNKISCSKCYIWVKLTFLKELMLIKEMHQNSVIFGTIGISSIMALNFN